MKSLGRISGAKKEQAPPTPSPMLLTATEKPFDHPDWLYEVKWDGYRAIAQVMLQGNILISRNGNSLNSRFPSIIRALENQTIQAVYDGEICSLDDNGRPNFHILQNERANQKDLYYYIFDILWLDGYSLMQVPLSARKELLAKNMPQGDRFLLSEVFDKGVELFQAAQSLKLEGIVAKKRSSIYLPAQRTEEWVKIKISETQSYVIAGWTEAEKPGKLFGALLLGEYSNGKLVYVGRCGSGFTQKEERTIYERIKSLKVTRRTLSGDITLRSAIHWTSPRIVAEFQKGRRLESGALFDTWIWKGWREDLNPKTIVSEKR